MTREERSKFIHGYSKLLTGAWADEKAMAQLTSNPGAALQTAGLDVPSGVVVNVKTEMGTSGNLSDQVRLWESGLKSGSIGLYVPAAPQLSDSDLSDEQLESVAGGGDCCCCCCPCCSCT